MTEQSNPIPEDTAAAVAVVDSNLPALDDEREDIAGIALPGYDITSEKEVTKTVQRVFKGFDPASVTAQFADGDAFVDYAKRSMTDIIEARRTSDATQLLARGASLARFWYLGKTIDTALSGGGYGANVIQRLTTELGKSQSYVYQIKQVAVKLTLVDCYLLGMRGLESSDLRKLAYVKDDKLRRQLIESYISAITDTGDTAKMEKARKALKAAILADRQADAIQLGASDPNNGGSEVEVSEEWAAAMSTIRSWNKATKQLVNETHVNESIAALANFYLDEDVPDAQRRLDELKMAAEDTRVQLDAAKKAIDDIIKELDSLSGVELNGR